MLLFMVVMSTTTFMVMMTVVMFLMGVLLFRALGISGIDGCTSFHGPGNADQFRDQCIRIFRRQTQLFGGKGDDRLLDRLKIIELLLDLGSTVGTVQMINDIYLSGHGFPSLFFILTYEQSFNCYQYSVIYISCQQKKPGTSGSGFGIN